MPAGVDNLPRGHHAPSDIGLLDVDHTSLQLTASVVSVPCPAPPAGRCVLRVSGAPRPQVRKGGCLFACAAAIASLCGEGS